MNGDISEMTNHKFSDNQLKLNTVKPRIGREISVYFPDHYYEVGSYDGEKVSFILTKEDAAAIARHFGIIE